VSRFVSMAHGTWHKLLTMANEAYANMGDERMPMCPGQSEGRDSDTGELKTLAELGRMSGRLLVGNRRPAGRRGHPKARKSAIQSISVNRTDVTGTNQGHDRGFAAKFTRALSHRAFRCPPATGAGSTGTAETIYFQTDRADTIDPTPGFTPAEGVDKLPQLPGSGNLYSIAYTLTNDATFRAAWTALADNANP
jgi:hypothetical protein